MGNIARHTYCMTAYLSRGKVPVSDQYLVSDGPSSTQPYIFKVDYYTDIDRDGHEISRFGGLPRELYFPKGLYFPEVHSNEGKYNYLGTTDT